ncbi:MAG: HAD-IIIC family phosphatase [Oscillospiraceae bacterium]|nr:HAD-IIIC family phosphatase [Oscillospiraceae bacterium]
MVDLAKIKLIIWDLDETLWEGTLSDNEALKIREEFVDFIRESLDRGIVHSICSKNDFEVTKEYLVSQDLWGLFVFPSINWSPKGERIKNIIGDMNLRAENILFVDDNTSNLKEATYYCPEIKVCTPDELLLSTSGIYHIGSVDKNRPRLAQYRLLEEKVKSQQQFSSNEAFLMSCHICVEFHEDCLENVERIHELIMRSNQLNYTKYRQDKESLISDLSLPDTKAAYITVKDDFGEYGIVGFYMILNGTVKHYLFSCRTLGMLVEQYVYRKIGCPQFDVVGDVITKLDNTTVPPWINQEGENNGTQRNKGNTGDLKILFKGPCDISQIFSFIEQTASTTAEFTYTNDDGTSVEGYNHTSQLVTSLNATKSDKAKLTEDMPWLDERMLDAASWLENDAIIFSTLTDGNLGIYQHKQTGWQVALCEKYYDLTDPKNWEDYIHKNIFTSGIHFTKEALVDFSEKYQYVSNADGGVTIQNLDVLFNAKKETAKLILVLGSEKAFIGPTKPSYENRHVFHEMLNRKMEAWAKGKKNVYLINIGDYIASQKDYLDTINHFQKHVYFHMAKDILLCLGDGQAEVKMKSKAFLYWITLKGKMKKFLVKLLKRA